MPKASAAGKVSSGKSREKSKHGYWIYKDGSSYWGIGIMKGGEVPLKLNVPVELPKDMPKTPEEIAKVTKLAEIKAHNDVLALHKGTKAEKIEWHKDVTAKMVEAAKEKGAKK